MTDPALMDADCIHGTPWYDCDVCTEDTPANPFADCDSPLELLGMLAGAASTCWDDLNQAGVFQAEQATRFVDAAMERLIELGWA